MAQDLEKKKLNKKLFPMDQDIALGLRFIFNKRLHLFFRQFFDKNFKP